jgi:16S rRNA (cytidine1402-2'-O)-methyltransferase
VVLAREVTKLHEEFFRGPAEEVLQQVKSRELKGEITLLIGKADAGARPAAGAPAVRERFNQLIAEEKLDEKAALKRVARELGLSRSEAYRELQRSK